MAMRAAVRRSRSNKSPVSRLSLWASAKSTTRSSRSIRIVWPSAFSAWATCLSLIEQVQDKIDQSDAEEQLEKLQKNQFTLDDFRSQLRQVKKLGSFSKILKLLPDQLLGGVGMPRLDRRAVGADGEGVEAHRSDHRFDDGGRATEPYDSECESAAADRAGIGHDGRAGELN